MTAGEHVTYSMDVGTDEIIEAGRLFYHADADKLNELVRLVMHMVGVDEDTAEDLISQRVDVQFIDTGIDPDDLGDVSWDIQRITGEAAKLLGFRGVEMDDEQGTCYLINMLGRESELHDVTGT